MISMIVSRLILVLLLPSLCLSVLNRDPCADCQNNNKPCKCDSQCSFYKDCCPNANVTFTGQETVKECKSIYANSTNNVPVARGDAIYMIATCPFNWTTDAVAEDIAKNCTSESKLPPVSDVNTGLTYRNEYCAICHGIDLTAVAIWSVRLRCKPELYNITNITLDDVFMYCQDCAFDPPPNITLDSRWCFPTIVHCPSYQPNSLHYGISNTTYLELVENCSNSSFDPVKKRSFRLGVPYEGLYHNRYCAMCNGVNEFLQQCFDVTKEVNTEKQCESVAGQLIIGPLPFSIVLDLTGSGIVRVKAVEIRPTNLVTCQPDEIFLPGIGCRKIMCPTGQQFIQGTCRQPLPQPTPINNITNETGSGSGFLFPPTLINCTTIALEDNEFTWINNLTILFLNERRMVVGFDSQGRPLICVFNITIRANIIEYPKGFVELTYIGCSLSIVGSCMILITYCLFSDLRTLPSQLLMNLAVAFLIGDVSILLGGAISPLILSVPFCTTVAILLHAFFLARFSWMTILAIEYTRTFSSAFRLRVVRSKGYKRKMLIFYLLLGWGIPLLITTITIIVNFTTDGPVRYGEDVDGSLGLCWINDTLSALIAFVLPISLATIFNIIAFVVIVLLLCIASRSKSKDIDHQKSIQIRVIFAVFAVLGLTWIFGFIALLTNQSWAWYPFIIFNSTQALIISSAFLFTKKVANRYISFLWCCLHFDGRSKLTDNSSLKTKDNGSYDNLSIPFKSLNSDRTESPANTNENCNRYIS